MTLADRLMTLINRYGEAKFKDEWRPGNAQAHIGAQDGAELETLLLGGYANSLETLERTVVLLNAYGTAKFGDEWWPGNAQAWIGKREGDELEMRLETPGYGFRPKAHALDS